jgi:HD superfamily phosphodiesterase/DNA-directed RNA polymerase subunit RPC12/RpoP
MAIPEFCPGSKTIRQPHPEYIKCSQCGEEVEIWTDEFQAKCPKCKNVVMREAGVSCFDWCKYAEKCAGTEIYSKYLRNKALNLKQKLLIELENYFGDDKKRINHAKKVLGFAEELLKKEKADAHIVITAAILHDVGIKKAEEKYGTSSGSLQEKEGPGIAREILAKFSLIKEDVDQICEIIAHHHSPGKINSQNFKVLYDADWLVNLKDEVDTKDKDKLEKIIDRIFLTKTGKKMAKSIYLGDKD